MAVHAALGGLVIGEAACLGTPVGHLRLAVEVELHLPILVLPAHCHMVPLVILPAPHSNAP